MAEQLTRVPLRLIHPHPKNANLMSTERREKLRRNIEREGRYPPLIVRPHPVLPGAYELLDGHQRFEIIVQIGASDALCLVWPCDDEDALLLLATLNQLAGQDVPVRRAELLAELNVLVPLETLALLLPEDASAIEEALTLLEFDSGKLLAELEAAATRAVTTAPKLVAFSVLADDEPVINEAVRLASSPLGGLNRRGRALAIICAAFVKEHHHA